MMDDSTFPQQKRSRSGFISQESPRKKNPSQQMSFPTPVIKRPKDAQSCKGMILRPKHKSPGQPPEELEGSIIPPAEKEQPESPRKKKKKPSLKKDSPPPAIKRPESPEEARSSEGMILRPKRKSPEKPSPPAEKEQPLPRALMELLKSKVPGKLSVDDGTVPPMYKGDDPEEAKRNLEARREWREARMFQYVGYVRHRMVSSRGFTPLELDICRPFMMKRDFELEDGPIPKDKKRLKKVLDQVRTTQGYGVTIDGTVFVPLKEDLENNPETMKHVQDMTKLLLPAMKRKRGLTYTPAGVKNLVKASFHYFLTLAVKPGAARKPQVVEALFFRKPGAVRKFQLLEWKIKEGSTVIFCTAHPEK